VARVQLAAELRECYDHIARTCQSFPVHQSMVGGDLHGALTSATNTADAKNGSAPASSEAPKYIAGTSSIVMTAA